MRPGGQFNMHLQSLSSCSCVYDAKLATQQRSLTPEGKYEGGGRCVDCRHNTAGEWTSQETSDADDGYFKGINCERCQGLLHLGSFL